MTVRRHNPKPAKAAHAVESDRTLLLRFYEGDFEAGEVPVYVLAQKMQALQTLLYHASAAVQGERSQRLGQWVSKHRVAAELAFAKTEPGSLKSFFNLRYQDEGLYGVQNKVLAIALGAVTAAAAGKPLPDGFRHEDRAHLLRAVEDLCPSTLDDYKVGFGVGKPREVEAKAVPLTRDTRRVIRELIVAEEANDPTEDYETIIGTLVQTNTGTGPDKIVLRLPRSDGGVEIDCFYPDSLRDQVANLIGGSLVEVTGFAARNSSSGSIAKFTEVIGLEMVDTAPIRLRSLRCDGMRYTFTRPTSFDVEYTDNAWAYSNELLNVSGVALTREAALKSLAEAMDYVWREFAKADDKELDAKAIELKKRLIETVKAKPIAKEAR